MYSLFQLRLIKEQLIKVLYILLFRRDLVHMKAKKYGDLGENIL